MLYVLCVLQSIVMYLFYQVTIWHSVAQQERCGFKSKPRAILSGICLFSLWVPEFNIGELVTLNFSLIIGINYISIVRIHIILLADSFNLGMFYCVLLVTFWCS